MCFAVPLCWVSDNALAHVEDSQPIRLCSRYYSQMALDTGESMEDVMIMLGEAGPGEGGGHVGGKTRPSSQGYALAERKTVTD